MNLTLLAQAAPTFDPTALVWTSWFVAFSFAWWVLIAIGSMLLIWALERESFVGSTIVFIASLAACIFCGGETFITWLTTGWNPLIAIGIYISGSIIWGFIKWPLFCSDRKEKYQEDLEAWLNDKLGEPANAADKHQLTADLKSDWMVHCAKHTDYARFDHDWDGVTKREGEIYITCNPDPYNRHGQDDDENLREMRIIPTLKLRANKNKLRITTWMAYWPWSLLWTFLAEGVKKFFMKLQKWCGAAMDRISDRIFGDTDSDFQLPETVENEDEEPAATE